MSYRKRSTLKNAAVNILVKHLDASELQCLRDEFEKIDVDGSGYIEIEELREALKNKDLKQTTEEIQAIIDQLDYAHNDKINYTEFIAATIDVRKIINQDERKLKAIFNSFDVDNTGFISRDNLKLAFSKYGRLITNEEIDNIMKEHDKKHTDAIDFQEFKTMVLDDIDDE
jgi:calcium-dependent protein kinase